MNVARIARSARMGMLAAAMLSVLTACGFEDREQVLARLESNLAAGNHRAAMVDLRNLIREEPRNATFRLQFGTALLASGSFESAEVELRKAAELGADPARVYLPLAEAQLGTRDFDAALATLGARPVHPQAAGSHERLRGQALLGLHRPMESAGAFRASLAAQPDDVAARLGLAEALDELEGAAAAKRVLDEALVAAPQNPAVLIAVGAWHMRQQQIAAARANMQRALQAAGTAKDLQRELIAAASLCTIELAAGNVDEALTYLRRVEAQSPKSEAALLLRARIALVRGDTDAAVLALQQVLSADPRHLRAQLLMGAATHAQGNLAQAEMYLSSVVSADPGDVTARRLLAEVQLKQMKPADVLATIGDPGDIDDDGLLALGGRASIRLGDWPSAIKYLSQGRDVAPGDVRRTLDLAAVYLAAGRAEEALPLVRDARVAENLVHQRERLLLAALQAAEGSAAARAEALRFATERPGDVQAQIVAAQGMLAAADASGARELLVKLTRSQSREPRVWLALGALEASQRELPAADRAFVEALRIDAHNVSALIGRAQLALARKDTQQARSFLEAARKAAADAIAPRVSLARLYFIGGEIDRATEVVAEARALAARNPEVRFLDGLIALARRRAEEASVVFGELAEDHPKSARVRVQLARAHLEAGRPKEALAASTAALDLDPGLWPATMLQASAALQSGQQALAEDAVRRLRDSVAPRALVTMLEGDLAMRTEAFEAAERSYAAAHASVPSGASAIKLYAAKRARGGDATAVLRGWLANRPDDLPVRALLAADLLRGGDRNGARREYEALVQRAPTDAAALNNLAWLELERGEEARALELAKRAYELEPGSPQVADTYGWALVQSKQIGRALPILRSAYRALPADREVRYHLAVALLRSGAATAARAHLEAIASADAGLPGVGEARQLLRSLDAPGRT